MEKKTNANRITGFLYRCLVLLAIAAVLMTGCFFSCPLNSHAATANETAENTKLTKKEKNRYLFIGNSLTYYNNSPEMFRSMVKTGTGKEIETVELVYTGRTLEEHAGAIAAVIRTKGKSSKLNEQEKKFFYALKKTTYSKKVYDGYAERIWDKENSCPKRFGTVILQVYYRHGHGDVEENGIADSIIKIINALNSPNTTYVVNATMRSAKSGLKKFVTVQNTIDTAVFNAVELAKKQLSGKYRNLRIAYTGRAFSNYLLQAGEIYAQKTEPEAYDIYTDRPNWKGTVNDLFYGDNLHPTQLGSYIEAATLYSLLFGDPCETTGTYKASVNGFVTRVDGYLLKKAANIAALYRNGAGFQSADLLNSAAELAYLTQCDDLRLTYDPENYPEVNLSEAAPELRKASKSDSGIQIGWKPLDGAIQYRVLRKTNDGNWKRLGVTKGISFFDATAALGHTYTYTVRCINKDGTEYTSSYDKEGIVCDYYAQPVLKSVTNKEAGVRIKWKASSGAERYRIYRKSGSGKWITVGVKKSTSFTDVSVESGVSYTYSVCCCSADRSRDTSSYDQKGLNITFVAAPELKNVRLTSGGAAKLTWKASVGAGQYAVYRKTGKNGSWKRIATVRKMSYTDRTIEKNVTYRYSVRCMDTNGKSAVSDYDRTGLEFRK